MMRAQVTLLLFLVVGCARSAAPTQAAYDSGGPWHADNWARISSLLQQVKQGSRRPVAVFDWDNTMMKNDIGDATTFWMLRHDKILQPTDRNWCARHPRLSAQACSALNLACDDAGVPGGPLATSTAAACADELLSIYQHSKTTKGDAAWTISDTPTLHAPYAFAAELLAGYSAADARSLARDAFKEASTAPIGTTWRIGTADVVGWLRIYPQMAALVDAAQRSGMDAWIVSASAQPLVEELAQQVLIPASHVIGVRLRQENGRFTSALEPCGHGNAPVMTYLEGKRCWINKVIFDIPPEAQLESAADETKRPFLVAGDSVTDLSMLQDATGLRLVINRQKTELMCHAYGDGDSRWLIQPMFIEPLSRRQQPFPCSTTRDIHGQPLKRPSGVAIADQPDLIGP